ncbi:MAG: hypothetical protein L0241_12670 [Planctomycetia bacterium]|nr:hypothetical protein [Planctomycetia bacterium]
MTPCWLHPVVVCSWFGIACLLTGCGPKEVRGVKLKGKVLKDGQPLKPLPGEQVWVTFEREPVGSQVIMTAGQMQKDGTFTLEGQEKKGTPPGKYTVTIHGEYSSDEGENRFESLFPEGKSSLVVEVTDQEDQNFVIDVGKMTITKQ